MYKWKLILKSIITIAIGRKIVHCKYLPLSHTKPWKVSRGFVWDNERYLQRTIFLSCYGSIGRLQAVSLILENCGENAKQAWEGDCDRDDAATSC